MAKLTNAEMVAEFMGVVGQSKRAYPEADIPEMALRADLMEEELLEYVDAVSDGEIVSIADALADLLYVVYGTAHAHGIPIDKVFAEVHRSNMTKAADGVIRPDGKVLKGPNFSPPDIEGVLAQCYQQ